ncbi:sigma-70 family RNA polymerase sigma factor [Vampirovibrio chlorellavorus]|uniref:sigma-70 family RNA polymerase sigma factor n=1 Tax=Vampirovibrio chlorellavorus TaxID=758823 RepID=UPI0026EC4DDB|nr:sigma-70 family RNA polymerase sigma factor [Vampirovibrio chlorellavorus]
MSSSPKKVPGKVNITQFLPLVERVAKVEYRRIPSHMVDYEELVSIGAIAIQALLKNKTAEEVEKLNTSYMATATRWAIRNELRSRYKWYTLKHAKSDEEQEGAPASGEEGGTPINGATANPSQENVREAIYETILSIEGIQEGQDGDTSYDFISDGSATPEESLEIVELGRAIKRAIESLPPKDRTIMEYRFYRNMQVKDIAAMVGLSSSRITRIVQASLNQVREYLRENNHLD